MTRILHTGDTHIGFRQYGLEQRRDDFSKAFLQIIQLAVDEKVTALVHAGDLFEDRNPSAEDLQAMLRGLFALRGAGIQYLGIVGNHEQRRGVQWIDLFASLDLAVHLQSKPYEIDGMPIYGLDFTGRREIQLPQCDGGVLACHQLLDKVDLDGELKLDSLWACGAQFVLLGDYHEHQTWHQKEMLVTYCGSTERWMLDEKKARGVNIIDLKNGRLDRRELKTRKFIYVPPDEDPLQRIQNANVQDAVVVVYLNAGKPTIAEIEECGYKHGALAVRVRDLRTPMEQPAEPAVNVEFGDLEQAISEALAKKNLSALAREIDQIIRDLKIPDSNVDSEVTELLERVR